MRCSPFFRPLALGAAVALAGCSASETASERAAPASEPIPTEVNSDAARRAIYNANSPVRGTSVPAAAVPDATPNTQRLGEQAADINRYKRPETLNTNDPNITPTETRMQELDRSIPDTLRRP
ncbi:MAG: hypothetical protein ACRYFK_05550 [Janthinobacterium lividum]